MAVKKLILLIDDEIDIIEGLKFLLKTKGGYDVATARNGVEALDQLKKISPHLIILDMNMPRMGGIEFYKNICDNNNKSKYPVLVLTARANLEELFKELDVDGFMTKPFDLDVLLEEVNLILQKRYALPETKKKEKKYPGRLIIIEDEKDALDQIMRTFLDVGYIVTSAKSAMEAIEKIVLDPPDLALIKLTLPDLSGDLLAAKLKQMPKTMGIEIILYTPESDFLNFYVTEKICEKIGVKELVESNDPALLLQKVEDIFNSRGWSQ